VNFAMLAALSGTIYFSNKYASLNIQSRSDLFIADFLQKVGAKAIIENGRLLQVSPEQLLPFEINACDYPDTIPPLVALACHIEGTSRIFGINRLRYKESNRAEVLQQEFQKAGAKIELDWENDCMVIQGGVLNSCTINSHGDHRIAMAAALLAAKSNISIEIINPECVNKTFPDYFERIHRFEG
jgi:3-phosphoshikimate 1-carboxyvinyltransferase